MSFLLSIIVEFLAEILIQFVCELGVYPVLRFFKRTPVPLVVFLLYALLGGIFGVASSSFFKELFFGNMYLQVSNLLVTPIVVGLLMSAIGRYRVRKGIATIEMDKFLYGFSFAFSMALSRFLMISY